MRAFACEDCTRKESDYEETFVNMGCIESAEVQYF